MVAPVFNKKGFEGTTLSDITAATGLTKGAIYGNFGSKAKLAEVCFDYNTKFLQKGLSMTWAVQLTSIGKLLGLIAFYEQNFDKLISNGGCPIMNVAIESDDLHTLFKEKAKTIISNWQSEIITVLKDGQATGEISSKTDAKAIANFYIASIEGGILIAKTTDDKQSFFDITKNLKSLVNNQLKSTI